MPSAPAGREKATIADLLWKMVDRPRDIPSHVPARGPPRKVSGTLASEAVMPCVSTLQVSVSAVLEEAVGARLAH